MHKKAHVGETSFAGRSFISSVADEDEDINILSSVLKMGNNRPTKLPLIGSQSVSNNARFGVGIMTPAERRVNDFLEQINQLDEEDQEVFIKKLDMISVEADDHLKSLGLSPARQRFREIIPEEPESGVVADDNIIELEEVKENLHNSKTPFQDSSETPKQTDEDDASEEIVSRNKGLTVEKRGHENEQEVGK